MALETIRGNVKVWINPFKKDGKEINLYSITVGAKNEDGTYTNASIPVSFSSKISMSDLTHGCDLKIKDAWLSAYPTSRKAKSGNTINAVKLFINEAQVVSAVETVESIKKVWTDEYTTRSAGLTAPKKTALKAELLAKYQPRIDALSIPSADDEDLPF